MSQTKQRTIDLVVRNDSDMLDLLKLLVWELKTVDGNRDSATKIKNEIK